MKVNGKQVLKNGAIAGYVYYKDENKWKWRIIGRNKMKGGATKKELIKVFGNASKKSVRAKATVYSNIEGQYKQYQLMGVTNRGAILNNVTDPVSFNKISLTDPTASEAVAYPTATAATSPKTSRNSQRGEVGEDGGGGGGGGGGGAATSILDRGPPKDNENDGLPIPQIFYNQPFEQLIIKSFLDINRNFSHLLNNKNPFTLMRHICDLHKAYNRRHNNNDQAVYDYLNSDEFIDKYVMEIKNLLTEYNYSQNSLINLVDWVNVSYKFRQAHLNYILSFIHNRPNPRSCLNLFFKDKFGESTKNLKQKWKKTSRIGITKSYDIIFKRKSYVNPGNFPNNILIEIIDMHLTNPNADNKVKGEVDDILIVFTYVYLTIQGYNATIYSNDKFSWLNNSNIHETDYNNDDEPDYSNNHRNSAEAANFQRYHRNSAEAANFRRYHPPDYNNEDYAEAGAYNMNHTDGHGENRRYMPSMRSFSGPVR
jgi:hypothetical protein